MKPSRDEPISIRGARVHNLQGVDCDIPRNRLVVITGPSGSGKSSLAFDTLYAEGQRRYVESLSAYARQFLDQMEKPDVESVSGLSPAIAIEQRTTVSHPRSTVGTVTEIYDHLRVLFAAVGRPHCPRCQRPVTSQTTGQIAERLWQLPPGTTLSVLAPVVRGRKGAFRKELATLAAQGYLRVRVDGRVVSLEEKIALDPRRNHRVEVLVDRLALRPGAEKRLLLALERALQLASDVVMVGVGEEERLYSRRLACARCDVSLTELSPRAFSFNSPYGACALCDGLGSRWDVDVGRVVPDGNKSLLDGAIHPWQRHGPRLVREALDELAQRQGFSLEVPFSQLPRRARQTLLQGDASFPGVLTDLRRRADTFLRLDASAGDEAAPDGAEAFDDIRPYLTETTCPECRGARLRPESLAVRLGEQTIADFVRLPVTEAVEAFGALEFPPREQPVAERLLPEILSRLRFLDAVGVGYLTLDRPTTTLSGGEAHRIRLASQIGGRMQGILYVLDEPSVGLHQRDNQRLLATLAGIRDLGNTVVVVEHDEETIRAADWILDLGEGAGRQGGRLMYQGPPGSIDGSLTGRYLRRELAIPVPPVRRAPRGVLRIRGAREHNLRDLDVDIPLGVLTAVTGVSGSGKSTLVEDILYRALARRLYGAAAEPGRHRALEGAEAIDKVVAIDQSPIGRTPRSNPATYAGAFTFIRDLFSLVPEARARGYKPGRFSFNVKGGRCEGCQGDGVRAIRMHFLPDVYVRCEACRGRRYNRETLEVLFHGRSVADVLDLTVEEALGVLSAHPRLFRILSTLADVGLGYIRLGQSAATLSGGEAQRVKLARELARRETGRTLYILDEPTTGLHLDDVSKLLHVLGRLVEAGNTVVVIEHNLEVVKTADHVIDLGPEAGAAGGRVVAQGTPERVARSRRSHTGRFLRPLLRGTSPARARREGAPPAQSA
ncbi:MAG TPA: excinuclease ABC subunit UvrA [Vicinamibacteria bacterium]|nr:excinuclease ABC subunit UvrA [Vicinamibacteria bacterium]